MQTAVQAAYHEMFPGGDPTLVARIFGCVTKCFRGECPEFQAIDARYHDLEHTLQGTLCLIRLLRGRHAAGVEPRMDQRLFELALLAILLHDTGYAKTRDDLAGTGAKYTFTHVARSAEFAARLLRQHDFADADILSVQNMIRCTGVNLDLGAIPFQSPLERVLGCALGTADLLGQMAAPDYVDKLPTLYAEFAEATAFDGEHRPKVSVFASAEDLIRRTPQFWEHHVKARINGEFGALYRFLEDPYPGGPNEYLDRIAANLERIRREYPPSPSPGAAASPAA